jgi:hypothetical protein
MCTSRLTKRHAPSLRTISHTYSPAKSSSSLAADREVIEEIALGNGTIAFRLHAQVRDHVAELAAALVADPGRAAHELANAGVTFERPSTGLSSQPSAVKQSTTWSTSQASSEVV